MEYITPSTTQSKILCCVCGISIDPNPTNQCIGCIRSKNDITEDIPKNGSIYYCRNCERYLEPPNCWTKASLESRELLQICLKKIKGMNKVRLVDAGFVWTEPHSKRIKVKLVVQKEIQAEAILQQDFIIEFVVHNQFCEDCHKIEAKDFWHSVVQVRQKTDHKRTFFYLEQLILKHKLHDQTLSVKPAHGGLNFYFANEQSATKLLNFLTSVVPCKWTRSKKLKSHDTHSNTYTHKISYSVELVPVCKDSVVCLPASLAHNLGGIGRICIIRRVTTRLFLIDPITAQIGDVNAAVYWRKPFFAVCTSKQLTEFIVIDVNDAPMDTSKGHRQISHKHSMCDVWVQRASELGCGASIFCRSHLGRILHPGDQVLGFDVQNSNVNDTNLDSLPSSDIPDVILVKKIYGSRAARSKKRKWKLKHLDGLDTDVSSQNRDYLDFLEDLEEDVQIRSNVNVYRDDTKHGDSDVSGDATPSGDDLHNDDEDIPGIALEDMLKDLKVEDLPDLPDSDWEDVEEEEDNC